MKAQSRTTAYILITIAALLFFCISTLVFLSIKLAEANAEAVRSYNVRESLKDSLSSLLDVETGSRGYLITRKEEFLEPFNSGVKSSKENLDRVDELTANDSTQQLILETVRKLANQKIAFSKEVIESPAEAKDLLIQGRGKVVMDTYRQQIKLMVDNETNQLTVRDRTLQQTRVAVWVTTAFMTIFSIGLLFYVYKVMQVAIETERRQLREMGEFNKRLQDEIQQRKDSEDALREASVKLASSNEDLQQFAYVASHDLQEPLRAVGGFLSLIASRYKGKLDPEAETWINHAVDGSKRMRALINDLLTFSRLESRSETPTKTDCNLALEEAKENLSLVIDETEAHIVSVRLPSVLGEQGQLVQLFQNLIGNGLKFRSAEKPIITINVDRKDDDWVFSVKDNGVGFDQEHSDRIFVIFQRLQGRDEYEGTGIGLALCKKIVERHGGEIWAESEVGKGSTFFFTIPVLKGERGGESKVD